MSVNAPSYSRRPIGSTAALARALGVTDAALAALTERSDDLYRIAKRIPKKDGTVRTVYAVREPLKSIQKRIQIRLLQQVQYPTYLMGGIRDPEKQRGYVRDAEFHSGAALLFSEDIESFFPSVSAAHVRRIFQHVIRLPPKVAGVLAKLCTRRGELPQGASTSTHLANLALFQFEPAVVARLVGQGIRYSRFVDDVSASSAIRLPPAEKTYVVRELRTMIERAGLRPKREKHVIASQAGRMRVHGLNVNTVASLDRTKRKNARAAVHALEGRLQRHEIHDEFERDLARATGRAAEVRRLHKVEGDRLLARLKKVRQACKHASGTMTP